jgi:hypothetical protein
MTIETKYNIGDEVWCANIFGEPFQLKIYGVFIEILGNRTFIYYYVGLNEVSITLKNEQLLFPTKEELLKSL